jgi:hypothetical protein
VTKKDTLPESAQTNRPLYFCCGFFFLIAILAYGAALKGPLFFDDGPNLLYNDFVKIDGTRFDDWRAAALSSGAGLTRRPVSMLTFALDHALFGAFSPAHLKAFNLVIHCAVALLIFGLAQALFASPALEKIRLGDGRPLALLAAVLWILHPLHVSTVLYAVQRMAQLSTLFVVAGLLVYCRYRLRWVQNRAETGEVLSAALWLFLLLVLAVFSKENGALLPWLILVIELTLFRGIWHQRRRPWLIRAGWLMFMLSVVCLALLYLCRPEFLTVGYSTREFTLDERILTQGRILWHYLYWLLIPDIGAMGFQHDDIELSRSLFSPLTTWVALLAWFGVVLCSWFLRNRFSLLLFAVLFYLVAHAMESTVLPLEMVYEHRNYLPAVGVAVSVAGMLGWVVKIVPQIRLGVAAAGILVVMAVLLVARTQTWSDEIVLARVNVENHPSSPRSRFFYANALFKRYERKEELQLNEQEELELAVAARHHFLKMHEIDGRDLAPLVMLYQIDSTLFSRMPDQVDWLKRMGILLQSRRLQASDYSALVGLINYFSHDAANADRKRFIAILDELIHRYPQNAQLLVYKFKFLSADDEVSPEVLLGILGDAERVNPDHLEIYPYQIVEYQKASNMAAQNEVARAWLEQDRFRRQLPALRQAFRRQ